MDTKLGRMVTYLDELLCIKTHMTLRSRGLVRSLGKLKSLYFHYQSAYGYKN